VGVGVGKGVSVAAGVLVFASTSGGGAVIVVLLGSQALKRIDTRRINKITKVIFFIEMILCLNNLILPEMKCGLWSFI